MLDVRFAHELHARGRTVQILPPPPNAMNQTFTPDTKKGFRVEEIGRPECPYLKRWVLQFGRFSIRLHHWRASDDARALHDHPWWFLTLVLKGGYRDISAPNPRDWDWENNLWATHTQHLRPGSIRFRPALHTHTVQVDPGGCWTLLLTGPHSRDWGFWVDRQWKRMRRYFKEHGHHPCEEGQV